MALYDGIIEFGCLSMNTEKGIFTLANQVLDVHFNGLKWTAKYKWKKYEPQLKNSATQFKGKPHLIHQFSKEIDP